MTRHDAERKRKILDYIAAMIRANGVPPSVPPPSITTSAPSRTRVTSTVGHRSHG